MKRFVIGCVLLMVCTLCFCQTNNPTSIYEGLTIYEVNIRVANEMSDSITAQNRLGEIKQAFAIAPNTQYSAIMASYYRSKVNLLPFVANSQISVTPTTENQISITLDVTLSPSTKSDKREIGLKNSSLLPVLYNSRRCYLTMRVAASEMAYSNDNSWFGQPEKMTAGNPLADSPSGQGWSAWLEGFASAGVYGVFDLIPRMNLHLYGGASYLISFSAGDELFTQKARMHGAMEDAFVGFVGGRVTAAGDKYLYNVTYGRKSFILGDGWLIVNTSMNGSYRAALQVNPRWAAKTLFSGSFQWNGLMAQGFMVKPNELDILDSKTTLVGANLQLTGKYKTTFGLSYITATSSDFRYYMPDGTMYSRKGLEVYNLRLYKTTPKNGGVFFKGELGYERNRNFDMNAWAYYAELGWNFAKTKGSPTVSYRYASSSGDNPDSKSYNRWDALYTGGNGEQWVQGTNMYKIVQNSNEITHRLQIVYNPAAKLQMVGQIWLFYADKLNNIGGNPALSTLKSKFYGSEYNLTIKYFYSRRWYFHFNTAYTLPGAAIKDIVSDTKAWYAVTLFARYSF